MDDLPLLMALRVQGLARPERAAAACGCGADEVTSRLAALVREGLAVERAGRISGYALTPKGGEVLEKLLAEEGARTNPELASCYDRFLGLNTRVLKVSTMWQVRSQGGVEVPNDHTDRAWDQEVIERLGELHESVRPCLEGMASCLVRYGPYGRRLDACLERVRAGDRSAFTAPLTESYHTVWFELHQDLLLTLGLGREA